MPFPGVAGGGDRDWQQFDDTERRMGELGVAEQVDDEDLCMIMIPDGRCQEVGEAGTDRRRLTTANGRARSAKVIVAAIVTVAAR